MEELKRFEKALNTDKEMKGRLDEICKRLAAEGDAQSDGEVMVQAAKELGYDISIAALEKAKAEAEALDPAELEAVAGGGTDPEKVKEGCVVDYGCEYDYHKMTDDEYGHDWLCLAVWHCFTAMLHTEGETEVEACWADYHCGFVNN